MGRREEKMPPFDEQLLEEAIEERLEHLARLGGVEEKVDVLIHRTDAQGTQIDALIGTQLDHSRYLAALESNVRRLADKRTEDLEISHQCLKLLKELRAGTLGNGHA